MDNDELLDKLTDSVLAHDGAEVITDMLNDWAHGSTTKWDIVRVILRRAAETQHDDKEREPV